MGEPPFRMPRPVHIDSGQDYGNILTDLLQRLCRGLYEGSILMKRKDFAAETVETFSWLESELNYTKEISRYRNYNMAKKIAYKKDGITITLVCDDRENMLFFEIFISNHERNLCIEEPRRMGEFFESEHADKGYINIEYESVFNYTNDVFDTKKFQCLKNNAELQIKKRGGRKKYIEVFSQLIKAAITTIEAKFL